MTPAQFIATYLEPILYGVVLLLATLIELAASIEALLPPAP